MRKLFLDDVRTPDGTWDIVRSYDEFVEYIQSVGLPDLISFDHDLAFEHYPFSEEHSRPSNIPYDKYTEKTGLHCARWLMENGHTNFRWIVHSMNIVGAKNLRDCLRDFCPKGEYRR